MLFVFAIQVIGVLLMFQPDTSLGCTKADWQSSFDQAGHWSVCPSNNAFLKGLERSESARGWFYDDERLGRIEFGKCCQASKSAYANQPAPCKDVEWTKHDFTTINRWALCPTGYYLNGFKPTGQRLEDLRNAKCCRPQNHPDYYGACYTEDVSISFDDQGLSECKWNGYYMTGLYKGNCNSLYCIEKFKCCKMP